MNTKKQWEDSDLVHYSDVLHKYVFSMRDNLSYTHDYGIGELCTSIESHLVLDIEENPGITVTDLAHKRGCSKSAISQAVNRLEKKELVQRAKLPHNQKASSLFITAKGRTLSHRHRSFDIEQTRELIRLLEKRFTIAEISTYFEIMEYFISLQESEEPS